MRNCLNKITKAFRKKSADHNQLEQQQQIQEQQQLAAQSEQDLQAQHEYFSKALTKTSKPTQSSNGIVALQSNINNSDKQLIAETSLIAAIEHQDKYPPTPSLVEINDSKPPSEHKSMPKLPLLTTSKSVPERLRTIAEDNQEFSLAAHPYIEEYQTMLDDSHSSPMLQPNKFEFEKVFNLSGGDNKEEQALRPLVQSLRASLYSSSISQNDWTGMSYLTAGDKSAPAAKTPEEIEYEANATAEGRDIMTPLPRNNSAAALLVNSNTSNLPFGHNLTPEIAEIIRNLDANTLKLNNLTPEDKLELMLRFEPTQQQHRRNSRSKIANWRLSSSWDSGSNGQQQQQQHRNQQQSKLKYENSSLESLDSEFEAVELRRDKLLHRRLPQGPKLTLMVKPEQQRKTCTELLARDEEVSFKLIFNTNCLK